MMEREETHGIDVHFGDRRQAGRDYIERPNVSFNILSSPFGAVTLDDDAVYNSEFLFHRASGRSLSRNKRERLKAFRDAHDLTNSEVVGFLRSGSLGFAKDSHIIFKGTIALLEGICLVCALSLLFIAQVVTIARLDGHGSVHWTFAFATHATIFLAVLMVVCVLRPAVNARQIGRRGLEMTA